MSRFWIARDKAGSLWIFKRKPIREGRTFEIELGLHEMMYLDESQFPSVTWENSPQQVELKLINSEEK